MGFEPTAACLGSRCATAALHPLAIQSLLVTHDSYSIHILYHTFFPCANCCVHSPLSYPPR